MKKLILFSFMILPLLAQQIIVIPGNKVDIKVRIFIDTISDTTGSYFKYEYKIKSLPTSEQKIWLISIPLPSIKDTLKVIEIVPFPGWGDKSELDPTPYISWGPCKVGGINWLDTLLCADIIIITVDSTRWISPGDSLSGFSFKTYIFPIKKSLLPDIGDFYVEGYHPVPQVPEGTAGELIPGYDDLTPYGPGKVYKTVTPGPLPPGWWAYDSVGYFVDDKGFYHLINKTNECFETGWLKERAKNHLIRMIERGLNHYKNNRIEQAIRVLKQVMNYLERERGNLVSDEAFYILYYRTKFVKEHLAWPAKK